MQIWKFHYILARLHVKTIPWKFLILKAKSSRVIYPWSLNFSLKVGYFLTYSNFSVCLQTNISYISSAYISKSKQCHKAKLSAYYFYVKTKKLVYFHICISVPLRWSEKHFTSLLKGFHQSKRYNCESPALIIFSITLTLM